VCCGSIKRSAPKRCSLCLGSVRGGSYWVESRSSILQARNVIGGDVAKVSVQLMPPFAGGVRVPFQLALTAEILSKTIAIGSQGITEQGKQCGIVVGQHKQVHAQILRGRLQKSKGMASTRCIVAV
jgi:hypothetical protein